MFSGFTGNGGLPLCHPHEFTCISEVTGFLQNLLTNSLLY